jgi:hypothetical protein
MCYIIHRVSFNFQRSSSFTLPLSSCTLVLWSTYEHCSVTGNDRDMHRCFLVPELVQLVCDEFLEDGVQARRTLIALALTCRLFHEPALDLLWRRVASLGPLVKCMPSDLWKVRRESEKELLV